MEADDVIGTLALRSVAAGCKVIFQRHRGPFEIYFTCLPKLCSVMGGYI